MFDISIFTIDGIGEKVAILDFSILGLHICFNVKITSGMNSSYLRTHKTMYYTTMFDVIIIRIRRDWRKGGHLGFFPPTHLAQPGLLEILYVFTQTT